MARIPRRDVLRGAAVAAPAALSLKAFGAVGDGQADDSAALQAALADAVQRGRTLRLPSGVYRLLRPLSAQLPAGHPISSNGISIIGESAANTTLLYEAPGDDPVLRITGAENAVSMLRIEGLAINRPDRPNARAGAGLLLESCQFFQLHDVLIFGHGTGLRLTNCNGATLSHVKTLYNQDGAVLEGGRFTTPNMIKVDSCTFNANDRYGLLFRSGSALMIGASIFEGNAAAGLRIEEAGNAGAVGVTFFGANYFENNGATHIHIRHGAQPALYSLTGSVFNVLGAQRTVSVLFDAGELPGGASPAVLRLEGSAFLNISDGSAPPPPSIQIAASRGYNQLTVIDRGALYAPAAFAPKFPGSVRRM